MANDGRSKCKLCGGTHRLGEPHEFPKEEPVPRQQPVSVTKVPEAVTKVPSVTKVMGRPRRYTSDAERQRAYRARRSSNG